MTLNFQSKIVFPAPECSYGIHSAFKQVVYLPRTIMSHPSSQPPKAPSQPPQSGQIPGSQSSTAVVSQKNVPPEEDPPSEEPVSPEQPKPLLEPKRERQEQFDEGQLQPSDLSYPASVAQEGSLDDSQTVPKKQNKQE